MDTQQATDDVKRALADRYAVERELGRGGMGTVYLARDLRLDRHVALKVLSAEFASDVALRDRFSRETRTAASFSHPNIVPVYAVEEAGPVLAYAMGFVEGETLTERVARMGPLPVREIVRVMQDVGYALAYAHGRGVVHRDIKPDNIMLERATGRALVLDFGISRTMTHAVVPAANLTRVGEVVGTPEYMSPEQASGDTVDGRSDLYSLGLVAHYATVGRTAVTGESTQKILVKQLTESVPRIADLRPNLPAALSSAIDRCVVKDPDERFASAEALVEAIDAAQLTEPEIPLGIRLFAGDAGVLSALTAGVAFMIWLVITSTGMPSLDRTAVIVLLLAILLTRAMTSLSEVHRLGVAGFTRADVHLGLTRVVEERARRRAELRADAETRRRRKSTLIAGFGLLVGAVVFIALARQMRVDLGGGRYGNGHPGIILVVSGISMLGISAVLLMKSPFRMPIGERFFRLVWLGPIGHTFVRFGVRGIDSGRRPSTISPAKAPESSETTVKQLRDLDARVTKLEQRVGRA